MSFLFPLEANSQYSISIYYLVYLTGIPAQAGGLMDTWTARDLMDAWTGRDSDGCLNSQGFWWMPEQAGILMDAWTGRGFWQGLDTDRYMPRAMWRDRCKYDGVLEMSISLRVSSWTKSILLQTLAYTQYSHKPQQTLWTDHFTSNRGGSLFFL